MTKTKLTRSDVEGFFRQIAGDPEHPQATVVKVYMKELVDRAMKDIDQINAEVDDALDEGS